MSRPASQLLLSACGVLLTLGAPASQAETGQCDLSDPVSCTVVDGAPAEVKLSMSGTAFIQKSLVESKVEVAVSEADTAGLGFWDDVVRVFQPVKQHIVEPVLRETVHHGQKFGQTLSSGVETGAKWAAGAAVGAAQWTAGAAEDAAGWTAQASQDAVKWGGTAAGDVASWTGGAASDVVQWSEGAVNDVAEWTENAVEDIQEFAEEVGRFLSGLGLDAKQWVEKLLSKIAEPVKKAVKNSLGRVAVCTGVSNFPDISLNTVANSPCFKTVTDIAKDIVNIIVGISSAVNRLGSVVANFLSDGDMYGAIFGMVGKRMVDTVEALFTLDFDRFFSNLNVANTAKKVIEVMATYFRKHASLLAQEIIPLIQDTVRYVNKIFDTLKSAVQNFVGGLSLLELDGGSGGNVTDPVAYEAKRAHIAALQAAARGWQGKTWYIALCGGVAAAFANMGVCIYYPFTAGQFPEPNKIVFEFGLGLQAEGGVEISGGIKLGPIFTNDVTSLTGSAQSMGVDIDMGTSGNYQFALDLGFTWPDPKGPMISFDIEGGVGTGINKANAVGGDGGDLSPFYSNAFGLHPLKGLRDFQTIPADIASAIADANAPASLLAVAKQSKPAQRAIGSGGAVSSNSGLAESAIDHKYSLLNGPCLPGTAIISAGECEYAYQKLSRRNIFRHTSRRGLVKGSWNGVPWACSIQYQGHYADSHTDSSPHFNSLATTDNSRAVSGEFRTICRRAFRLHTTKQASCPAGSAITSARECWDAYVELQGHFQKAPKRQLVKGSWGGVPVGCSIQYEGHYVNAHQDQSPHWNTIASSDGSRATSGEFRLLCKPQRFWTEDATAAACSFGSTIEDPDQCQVAYDALRNKFAHPARRGLVQGHWSNLPVGCSQQFQGSFVNAYHDQSPHFNTYGNPNPTRSTSGEFVNICKEPSYWMATTKLCPKGLEIKDQFVCKAAYEHLRNEFTYIAKRGLVTGSWAGVPPHCSVQQAGSFVTSNGDSSPHFNSNVHAHGSRSQSGEFRPLCLPGKYFMPTPGASNCPGGTGIATQEECQQAYDSFGQYWTHPAKRGMVAGSWYEVPKQCSIQYQHAFVNAYSDQSPHWNTHGSASGSRGASSEFVPICKAA